MRSCFFGSLVVVVAMTSPLLTAAAPTSVHSIAARHFDLPLWSRGLAFMQVRDQDVESGDTGSVEGRDIDNDGSDYGSNIARTGVSGSVIAAGGPGGVAVSGDAGSAYYSGRIGDTENEGSVLGGASQADTSTSGDDFESTIDLGRRSLYRRQRASSRGVGDASGGTVVNSGGGVVNAPGANVAGEAGTQTSGTVTSSDEDSGAVNDMNGGDDDMDNSSSTVEADGTSGDFKDTLRDSAQERIRGRN